MAGRLTNGKNRGRKSNANGRGESTVGIVPPELVLEARREISGTKIALEQAQTNHRNCCKRFQGQGVNTKALIEVIQLRKKEPEVVVAHFKDVFRYARIEKAEFAQADLFAGVQDTVPTAKARAEHADFEHEEAGYIAGRRGFDASGAPGKQGDKSFTMWMTGWHRGQAAIAEKMGGKDAANSTVATPKKRGRPPAMPPTTGSTTANPGRKRAPTTREARVAAAVPDATNDQPTLLQ